MSNMKINLGCGGTHKKGYLNVDAFDDTIADKIMSASDLKFEDNTIDEILLSQAIEHLGIIQSLYTISECFRVLKPNAKLIIETPDIRAAFRRYLEGNLEIRKNVLPWIYGVDMLGMLHRFCFPEDLLEEILSKNGYVELKKYFFSYDKDQPILHIVGKKREDYQVLQFISKFRKKLIQEKLVDFNDQIPSLEKEDLIKIFAQKIDKWFKKKDKKIFDELAIEGASYSPMITHVFFEEMVKQDICFREDVRNHCRILKKLVELKFSDVLFNKLTQIDRHTGKQEDLFIQVWDFCKIKVEKLLNGGEEEQKKVLLELANLSKKTGLGKNIEFFSPKLVMLKANKIFQKGVKEFNLTNYKTAIDEFKKAESIYRDQILTYWNLGRLYALNDDIEQGISYYNKALLLTDIIDYENKNALRRALKQEIKDHSTTNMEHPIISLQSLSSEKI